MRLSFSRLLCVALVAWLTVLAGYASGRPSYRDRQHARSLANAGLAAYKKGKFQQALESFESAEQLLHAPPHLLYQARCQAKLGALLRAHEIYSRVATEELRRHPPRAFVRAKKRAVAELRKLDERIPKLSIELASGPAEGAAIAIDGKPVEGSLNDIPVETGEHEVTAHADGYEPVSQAVSLAEGAHESVALQMQAKPPPPPPPEEPTTPIPTLPIAVLGAGTVALVVGTTTGVAALDRASALNDMCPANPCPTENQPLADEARSLGTVSTVGFVVGGLAAAGGGAWLLFELLRGPEAQSNDPPSDDLEAAHFSPLLGLGYAGVRGRF